jgi:hypothetical protein
MDSPPALVIVNSPPSCSLKPCMSVMPSERLRDGYYPAGKPTPSSPMVS